MHTPDPQLAKHSASISENAPSSLTCPGLIPKVVLRCSSMVSAPSR